MWTRRDRCGGGGTCCATVLPGALHDVRVCVCVRARAHHHCPPLASMQQPAAPGSPAPCAPHVQVVSEALQLCGDSRTLWEAAIHLEEASAGADRAERGMALYARCTAAPAKDSGAKVLPDKEREELRWAGCCLLPVRWCPSLWCCLCHALLAGAGRWAPLGCPSVCVCAAGLGSEVEF
jgi:hypothetical protein